MSSHSRSDWMTLSKSDVIFKLDEMSKADPNDYPSAEFSFVYIHHQGKKKEIEVKIEYDVDDLWGNIVIYKKEKYLMPFKR